MSKPSHTPGPWEAYTETGRGRKHREWWVASVGPGFALPVSAPGAPQEYDEANARLISAAPAMYELLRRLADAYPGNKAAMLGNGVAFQVAIDARKVIAKAEGRE